MRQTTLSFAPASVKAVLPATSSSPSASTTITKSTSTAVTSPLLSTPIEKLSPSDAVVENPLVKRVKLDGEVEIPSIFRDALPNLDDGWQKIVSKEASKPYAKALNTFVENEYKSKTIYPERSRVLEALRLCPMNKVKVVILGQDPYHGPKQAHGLSFSVQRGIEPPPSLKNIFKESISCGLYAKDFDVDPLKFPTNRPSHGHLEHWATQGVLMLNACLTVQDGKPKSHEKRGWEVFTDALVANLSKEKENLVFMLWGEPAKLKGQAIVGPSKHLIITSSHPSPLGAAKTNSPFLGSRCFAKCNAYLKAHSLEEIDWNLPA